MKLYDTQSGNTKRVRIFIAEKGIEIPRVQMELGADTRSREFQQLNTLGELPVLELDDGRMITESLAICRYLEAVYPDRPLMGTNPFEQGHIEMWSQRIYMQLFMTHGNFVRHSMDLFAAVMEQVPEFAAAQRRAIPDKWVWLDDEMSDGRAYIAGDTFTMADVQAMTVLMIADGLNMPIPGQCVHVNRWADAMRDRPSFHA
ncbi:MAG: glutathione S-transferase family protein [Alphaproteobacteria bacterium]|nr:glutathione S-transferase family protein [Alphaproteobacteria bacterium]